LQLNANGTSFYNGFTQAQNGSVLTNTIHPPITFPGGSGCCNAHLRTTPIIMAGTNASLGFGPLSVGIFARDATTTRTQTGAAYYGAMEMSGNVWEQCVSVTNGTTYDGVWGDGYLDASGQANTVNWPGGTGTGGTFTNRALRGGGYDSPWELCRVADRQFWNNTDLTRNGTVTPPNYTGVWRLDNGPDSATSRRGAFGGRGVR
jgi:hypothetical protein